ncbi:hypothetical protein Srot_2929 [Segniliparus rotundus DSM 44985]|uniref:Uncharacterized protein n=1 Tax=Segniliparus rotundus (strain ATCC BAA-972 / CDC 1076 / CIP 108378 / DSM 44985 / JCM 13578) TaxID=640132 RepID=D6ZDV1_SEGRD|nr:hypothetical protein [Segniliparus rotundus]ADG99358.1 hypothetical protein Srot_2929 [Segniliparus rotundus DSM 44985]
MSQLEDLTHDELRSILDKSQSQITAVLDNLERIRLGMTQEGFEAEDARGEVTAVVNGIGVLMSLTYSSEEDLKDREGGMNRDLYQRLAEGTMETVNAGRHDAMVEWYDRVKSAYPKAFKRN